MDEKQLRELLKQPESVKLEFKSQMYQLEGQGKSQGWNELIKDLIALANGNIGTANQEGYLIIGAADKLDEDGTREIYDVGEIELTQTQLLDRLRSYCDPPFQDLSIESFLIDGKTICVVTIPPSDYLYELKKTLRTKTREFSEGNILIRRNPDEIDKATDQERVKIRKEKENRHQQESTLYKNLTSYQYIESKIQAGHFSELIESYADALKPIHDDISEAQKENLALIQASLRICEKIVDSDTTQLASQLIGRLAFSPEPDIQRILEEAEEKQEESEQLWLKPLSVSLQAPVAALRHSLKESSKSIHVIAVNSSSSKLIAGFAGGTLKIWDLCSGQSTRTWEGHNQQINHIAITPDDKKIISASDDSSVKVWDINSSNQIFSLSVHQAEINAIAVTSDSEQVILAFDDGKIEVWSLTTGACITPTVLSDYPFEDPLTNLITTKDGEYIIFAVDTKIYVWQQSDNSVLAIEAHDGKIKNLILLPCNNLLLSVSDDDTLKIWNLDDKTCEKTQEGIFVKDAIINPDKESVILITDDDNSLRIWYWKPDKLDFFECNQKSISALAITPDGKRLITASSSPVSSYEIYIWDWRTRQPLIKLADHTDTITQLLITANNQYLVSASKDKTIKVWKLLNDQALDTLHRHGSKVKNIVVTPNGDYAISVSEDSLKLWKTDEGKHLKTLPLENKIDQIQVTDQQFIFSSGSNISSIRNLQSENPELVQLGSHTSLINDFVLTPDEKYVISASDDKVNNLRVWDLSSQTFQSFEGHDEPVELLNINNEQQWLISVSPSKTLIWSLKNFELLYTFDGESQAIDGLIRYIRINSKDKFSISADGENLKIWNLSTGKLLYTVENEKDKLETIAASSNQRYLVFPRIFPNQDSRYELVVLDIQNISQHTFPAHDKTITSVAITPCDRYLISTSSDSTLKVWSLEDLGKFDDDSRTNQPIATFTGSSEIATCSISNKNIIIAGEESGRVHFLELRL